MRRADWESAEAAVYLGDCLGVLAEMPAGLFDAVITDPPYDLTSGKRTSKGGGGFMGKAWDGTGIAFSPVVWAECLRVLKPGGHLLAFGGSRTWHRLACAIEDAGFEMRDSIAWLYGSGFPKSLDVSKAIDKAAGAEREIVGQHARPAGNKPGGSSLHMSVIGMPKTADLTAPATLDAQKWQGWGTALKPAHEPIVVARKPFVGTVAANVLTHGTGALNIDACRVGTSGGGNACPGGDNCKCVTSGVSFSPTKQPVRREGDFGRWPANVVLDDSQAAELDRQSGTSRSAAGMVTYSQQKSRRGASATVDTDNDRGRREVTAVGFGDEGGASRFFPTFRYQAKAPTRERPKVDGVGHPTVKPLELMRWLVRLVTPPGGLVLDPFAGSGTTAQACQLEGAGCIAIESEADYFPLIVHRLSKPTPA